MNKFFKVNYLFLKLCFLILFFNQAHSQSLVSNGAINKYYLLYSLNDSKNLNEISSEDLVERLRNTDSIIFKDTIARIASASLMFLGNNKIHLYFNIDETLLKIDTLNNDSIFGRTAEHVVMGNWFIKNGDIFLSFINKNEKFDFILYRREEYFIMKKV